MELLLQSASAAASVGLGCGTCCGSGIGVVLSGYLMTHAKDWKQSWKGAGWFYMGKLLSVVTLCVAASVAGGQLMDESGKIAGFPMRYAVDALMLCAGIYFLVQCFREKCGSCSCHACGHCGSAKDKISDTRTIPCLWTEHLSAGFLWVMGAGYGLTSCAPLIMVVATPPLCPWHMPLDWLCFCARKFLVPHAVFAYAVRDAGRATAERDSSISVMLSLGLLLLPYCLRFREFFILTSDKIRLSGDAESLPIGGDFRAHALRSSLTLTSIS